LFAARFMARPTRAARRVFCYGISAARRMHFWVVYCTQNIETRTPQRLNTPKTFKISPMIQCKKQT